MTRCLQTRQSRIRRRFGPIAIEQISEDVCRDVLALRCDVRVDVELQVAIRGQRAGAVDSAVQKLGEPEEVVLFSDGPVKIDSSFWRGVLADGRACLVLVVRCCKGDAAAVARARNAAASWFGAGHGDGSRSGS